ncbi:MAG: GDP-mannose 4,6-dehydratase [Candidatus Woesearchaeota archaeon]
MITGAGGFMGPHLIDYLLSMNHEVLGTYFQPTTDISSVNRKAMLMECDVRDREKVFRIINEFKPERIFHLAAQSYPSVSWEKPNYTVQTNIEGTVNIFEAVKKSNKECIIMNACSSAEYGFVTEDEVPVKESRGLRPLHPYGVSKVAQELLAYQYWKNFKVKSVSARIFNTTGPRKVNDVCSDFTKRAVMIEKGQGEKRMRVGTLETRRAITDVRDIIRAFWLLTEKGEYGEAYNLSGAKVYSMKELLDIVLRITKLEGVEIWQDPELIRPTDEPIIFGSTEKFSKLTGWKQEILIETTLKDMVEHWRSAL